MKSASRLSRVAVRDFVFVLLLASRPLPVFASDAISSVAYATQQIILALGAAGLFAMQFRAQYTHYTMLITGLIVVLLVKPAGLFVRGRSSVVDRV